MKMEWSPEDEAFRAELIAFLDEHTPPEACRRYDFFGETSEEGDIIPHVGRATWQATLFDHGWMVPALPARARRSQLHPGADAHLPRGAGGRGIPRVDALPRLRDRGTEPARVRQRRAEGARAGRDPRRHRLVHRHERARRGLRPRRPPDARRGPRRRRSSSTARRCGRRYAIGRSQVLLLRAHRPDAHRSTRASRCSSSTWTRRASTFDRCATSTATADFAEVFFTDVVVPRENLVGELNDGWRITLGSLAHERAGLWVEGVAAARADGRRARRARQAHRPRPRPGRAPSHRRGLRAGGEPARARLQGLRLVRPGLVGARALVHEAGDVRARARPLFELGMELRVRSARSTDADGGEEAGRWVHSFFVSFANTIAGGTLRDPTQHHRPACPRAPEE